MRTFFKTPDLRNFLTPFVFAVSCLLVAACGPKEDSGSAQAAVTDFTPLKVLSHGKVHHFKVETADDSDSRAKGLMHRKSLADDRGMIFIFDGLVRASFWMKNTLIPLDILFIKDGGEIESIAAQTKPMSLDSIRSHGQVIAVLEIRGGLAAELGIQPGDRVIHHTLGNSGQ